MKLTLEDEKLSMIRIVSILYCHEICSEFRSPVEILYPDLKDEYLSMVKYPMDLGSILMNCLNHKMTTEVLCRALQLVFVNALVFNKGTPVMESLATHLFIYAGELYEEAIGKHYFLMNDSDNDENIDSKRLNERHNRMLFAQHVPLANNEIKYFIESLERVKLSIPNELSKIVKDVISSAKESLKNGKRKITLHMLLLPLMNASIQHEGEDQSMRLSSLPALFELVYPKVKSTHVKEDESVMDVEDDEGMIKISNVLNSLLPYLRELDIALGELLIIVKERETRGIATSSIWARNYRMLWAQPNKGGGLFPCMLLAGGPSTDVPTFVNKANWERIPPNIMKQLIKCKPKVSGGTPPTTCWSDGNIIGDYYIVEYFGNHEFGWVRSENVIMMTLDEFVIPPKAAHNGAEAIEEAEEAFNVMKEMNDISHLNGKTAIDVPTVTELEEIIETLSKDVVKVFEKVQSIPVNIFTDLNESLQNIGAFGIAKGKVAVKKANIAKEMKEKELKDKEVKEKESKEKESKEKESKLKNSKTDNGNKADSKKIDSADVTSPKGKLVVSFEEKAAKNIDFENLVVTPSEVFKESKIYTIPSLTRKQKCILKAGYYSKWLNGMKPLKLDASEGRKRRMVDIENDGNKAKKFKEEEKRSPVSESKNKNDKKNDSLQHKIYSIPMTEKEEAAEIRNRSRTMVYPVPVGSCTKHFKGSGVVHSKILNPNNRIFHYEHHSKARRKEILRKELVRIRNALVHLQSNSAKRDKPKKDNSLQAISDKIMKSPETSKQSNIETKQPSPPTFIQPPKPPMAPKVGLIQKMEQLKKMQALASLNQQHHK